MSPLVLDTNIVSFLMQGTGQSKRKTASWGELYRPYLEGHRLAISFMTVGELYEGAYRKGWSDARLARLDAVLQNYLVIPATPTICRIWARIRTDRKNQPIAVDDAWIAATALAYDCPLVTHNPADFQDISGLLVVSALASK